MTEKRGVEKPMTTFKIDEAYRTTAGFFLSSAVWFVVFTTAGFILASWMIAPDLFLYRNVSWLVFSRVRPVHTNGMIFGFVGSALIGAVFYYVPRLVRAPSIAPSWDGSPFGCGIR